jgi:hypothetical protein
MCHDAFAPATKSLRRSFPRGIFKTEEGEADRNRQREFAYGPSAWEHKGVETSPVLHREPLNL